MSANYSIVRIGRLDDDDPANYLVRALPEGASFKDPENWDTFTASWLKVNGIGFACGDSAEFSQHGETAAIEQDTDGGPLEIVF